MEDGSPNAWVWVEKVSRERTKKRVKERKREGEREKEGEQSKRPNFSPDS